MYQQKTSRQLLWTPSYGFAHSHEVSHHLLEARLLFVADNTHSTESQIARLHCRNDLDIVHSVNVHSHLLNGRALRVGKIYHEGQTLQGGSENEGHNTKAQQDTIAGTSGMSECQFYFLLVKMRDSLREKHEWLVWYRDPVSVDSTYMGTPDYNDIIKHPMDLGTMYDKLKSGEYGSMQAFEDDLQLIVRNAETYNGAEHPVTKLGYEMYAYTREFMEKSLSLDHTRVASDSIEVFTEEVELGSKRALVLWSRWLYGTPMWSQEDCKSVDEDLSSLASIYKLYAGDRNGDGMHCHALNACLDAIKQILLNEIYALSILVQELDEQLKWTTSIVSKMLVEMLVHGKDGGEGKTMDWPQDLEHKHHEFFGALGLELARTRMRKAPPNFMARCAYHTHPVGPKCDETV